MEYFVTPNEPRSSDSNLSVEIVIVNPLFYWWIPFTLSQCSSYNRVYMNPALGAESAPDYLSLSDQNKQSGITLRLGTQGNDWSTKQYLIIFKSDVALNLNDPLIEIYHNGDRVESEQIVAGDDRFALIVPGEVSDMTHLFFRLANWSRLWFKEIEVQLI